MPMRPISLVRALFGAQITQHGWAGLCVAAALVWPVAPAWAQTAAATPLPAWHPLVGLWQSVVRVPSAAPDGDTPGKGAPGKSAPKACRETLDYRANRIRLGTSGQEITRSAFTVTPGKSAAGFYRLSDTVLASNGKADCAGDVHAATDDTTVRFVQFSPQRDQFIVCKDESLAACFGPFRRQP